MRALGIFFLLISAFLIMSPLSQAQTSGERQQDVYLAPAENFVKKAQANFILPDWHRPCTPSGTTQKKTINQKTNINRPQPPNNSAPAANGSHNL